MKVVKRVAAALNKPDAGSSNEVSDCSGHQDLARPSQHGDSRGDMHSDPAHVILAHLNFPRVQASPNFDAERAHRLGDPGRATDRPSRSVKDRKETISQRLHFRASEPYQLTAHRGVVGIQLAGMPLKCRAISKRRLLARG